MFKGILSLSRVLFLKQKTLCLPALFTDQRGNIFFTLFGAVAIIGLLGTVVVSTIRGPVTTMVEVQSRAKAESEMNIASRLALLEATELPASGDCDGDGFVEPLEYLDAGGAGPTGGGFIPAAIASEKVDPWGTNYGYCAWDAGATTGAVGCDTDASSSNERLDGNASPTDETYTVIAIISAGPNQIFETTCTGGATPSITKGGDDILVEHTYATANSASGGLWNIKSGDPNTAEIGKNIEVTGGASFTAGIDLTSSSAALQLGAASMLFPDQTTLTTCNSANDGLVRLNTTPDPDTLQLCDDPNGWVSIGGGLWSVGTGDDIYYNTGTPQVGIGKTNPSEALDVTGNIVASGNITATGNLSSAGLAASGNATVGGTLGVTGATTLSTLNATGAVDFDSTLNVDGAATLGSTLSVTGATTLQSTLDAQGAISNSTGDVSVSDNLVVTGTSDLQGNISDSLGDLTVDDNFVITGTTDARGSIANSTGNLSLNDDTDVTGDLDVSASISAGTTINVNGDQLGPAANCGATEKLQWTNGSGWSCVNETAGPVGEGLAVNLNDLADVNAGSPSDLECLIYDNSAGEWENGSCAAGGGIWEESGTLFRISNAGTYSTNDLVFGSPSLGDDTDATHDSRFFFDKSKGAFRVGEVTGAEWDDANVGTHSYVFGYNATASGANSVAFGLGTPAGASPIVSGASSYGIFMGDQSGVDVSAANTFSLMGGTMAIGATAAATGGTEDLELHVAGDVGADNFCDSSGNHCFDPANGGLWTDLGGDRIHYGSTGSEQVGVGTTNPQTTLDVNGGLRVGSVSGGATPNFLGLSELDNVDAGTPANGECLVYNNVSGLWENNSCSTASATASLDDADGDTKIWLEKNADEDMIRFDTDGAEAMIISNIGNVGIATSSPEVALHVNGTIMLAYGGETCTGGNFAGAMRYQGGVLEYCDGTDWITLSASGVGTVLAISPAAKTNMDVDGTGCGAPPCDGTTVTFTVTNQGDTVSDSLTYTLDNTTNFTVMADTCTGNTLAQNATCQIDVRPSASGNNLYTGELNIPHHNAPTAMLQGTGSNFGCVPGLLGYGGVVADCDTYGAGNHLVVMPGNCDGTTLNPTCDGGGDTITKTWGPTALDLSDLTSDANDGAQATVNLMSLTGHIFPAAEYCSDMVYGGYDDWFLPGVNQWTNYVFPNAAAVGGSIGVQRYWSSNATNANTDYACYSNGSSSCGSPAYGNRADPNRVRCVRVEGIALPAAQSDNTPETLSFDTKFATTAGVSTTSDTLNVSGISYGIPISISGATAEYSINGGGYTAVAGTIDFGDTVTIRMDSPAAGTRGQADLTIGASTFPFSVMTQGDCGGSCAGIDKRVFVSSTDSHGDKSGVGGADAICQGRADSVSLGGSWMAIIGDSDYSSQAAHRIPYNWDRLVNMNGSVIADDIVDLWDGSLDNGISYDETGALNSGVQVHTGMLSNGMTSEDDSSYHDCNNWNTNNANGSNPAKYGTSGASGTSWAQAGTDAACSIRRHVYCIETEISPIVLSANVSTQVGMDVTGPGAPSTGSEVVFTITNNGSVTTGALSHVLSNTINFTTTTDTCSGNTIASAATCTIGVTPQAYADGSIFGLLTVHDSTNSVSVDVSLFGTATGFTSGPTGVFAVNTNVVQGLDGVVDYSTDDFVFGSPQLDDDTDTDHDKRFFFDKSKAAFRVGEVTGTEWDDGNIGTHSYVFGYNATASGANSVAFGLGTPAGASPIVSGAGSFGIFMGDQNGVDLSTASRMGLYGGDLLIDDDGTAGSQGCIRYVQGTGLQYSNDCSTFSNFGGGGGLFTDNTTHITRENFHILDTGQTTTTASLDGSNTRSMIYMPDKGALAGGQTPIIGNTDARQDANIGANSFSWGSGAEASGSGSFAWGHDSTASGTRSAVFGFQSTATNFDSIAIGLENESTGFFTLALGNRAVAQGNGSVSIGLADETRTITTKPVVSGKESLGIFMGDQDGVDLSTANRMGLYGGDLLIDDDGTAGSQGCIRYVQGTGLQYSNDCSTFSNFGGGGSGVFEVNSGVVRNTGTHTSEDFVFGSTQLADTGTASNDARFFFDKSKGAFRAGRVNAAQWDDGNVGTDSIGLGDNVTASGANSIAIGDTANASQSGAIAIGVTATSSGTGSLALGSATSSGILSFGSITANASGDYSFASGLSAAASGNYSVALGRSTTANTDHATAVGYLSSATGNQSFAAAAGAASGATAVALSGSASGSLSLSLGGVASGASSRAISRVTTASGISSISMGDEVVAGSGTAGDGAGDYSVAVGLQSASQATDPIVTGDRSFVVFMDGNSADANSGYDFTASDKFAIIGGEFQIDSDASTAAKGCISYNDSTDKLQYSHDCSSYADFGGGGGGGLFTDNTTHITRENFHIIDSASNSTAAGLDGDGTYSFYDSNKAAFRAGVISGSNAAWENANVGLGSFAYGQNARASASLDAAFGIDTIASGGFSMAIGNGTEATANAAFAAGFNTNATGQNSAAFGSSSTAGGYASFAIGEGTSASGAHSFTAGRFTTASGSYSAAFGVFSQATGAQSFSAGGFASGTSSVALAGGLASGANTVAIGSSARASGVNAVALGTKAIAGDGTALSGAGDYSMAIGLGNASTATHPRVTGDSSLGIFMGDQNGYDLTTSNRMALVGGDFLIDDDGTAGSQGCIRYVQGTGLQYSNDCSTFSNFGGAGALSDLSDATATNAITALTFLGQGAGQSISSGTKNTFVGSSAGTFTDTGLENVAVGDAAFVFNRAKRKNTAIGSEAMSNATNNTTLADTNNTAVGYRALYGNLSAASNTGTDNTALGSQSLLATSSGSNNIGVGSAAGDNITTGSNNIIIGYNQDAASATGSNQLNIGGVITGDMSTGNITIAGTAALTVPSGTTGEQPAGVDGMIRYNTTNARFEVYENSAWVDMGSAVSDARLKKDITPLDKSVINKLAQIPTYSYRMKADETGRLHYGVLAQDVENIFPTLVKQPTQDGDMKSVDYMGFIAPLIEASKELRAENTALKAEIASVKDAQAQSLAKLEDISQQVALLNKVAGQNVDKASMQPIWMLLLGLLLGGSLMVVVQRKSTKQG